MRIEKTRKKRGGTQRAVMRAPVRRRKVRGIAHMSQLEDRGGLPDAKAAENTQQVVKSVTLVLRGPPSKATATLGGTQMQAQVLALFLFCAHRFGAFFLVVCGPIRNPTT